MRYEFNEKQKLAWRTILTNPDKKYILFDGGARSGKTTGFIEYIIMRAFQFPGSRQLMARKSRSHAKSSLWSDSLKKYLLGSPQYRSMLGTVFTFNETELILRFYNGSEIIVGGLDNAERVEKILGTEYITVFLNEATQLSYDTMQMVITRLAQRCYDASGRMAVPKLLIDCNPRGPRHWLHYVGVRHVDPETEQPLKNADAWARMNWSAYDNMANLPQDFIKMLESLPDIKRDRMLNGVWRDNDGAVYSEFDEDIHTVEPFRIPADWTRVRSIDFGFTNPFVCLWGAVDHDGRLYIYRELYRNRTLTAVNAETILEMSGDEKFLFTVADHDAEERAELNQRGVPTVAARKDVIQGIQLVKQRLVPDSSGKPRVFFFRNLKNILNEMYAYEWLPASEGRNAKEEPRKENDHAMDALRYMIRALEDNQSGSVRDLLLRALKNQ